MNDDELIDYLIEVGEAVQYGDRWTEKTTYEYWVDESGKRHCRQVMTYHGGGLRGDDDEAEYVRRLLDMGRAQDLRAVLAEGPGLSDEELREVLPEYITHVIRDDKAHRIRYYVPAPE